MSIDKLDFEALIAPVTTDEFFARYWELAPLVVARREPERYASLLPPAALDDIIDTACGLHNSSVELLGDAGVTGTPYAVEASTRSAVEDAYGRGATVRVNNVQQFSSVVRAVCGRLEQVFNFPLRANLYRTPATAQGAQRHYDNHDILVLQVAGRKRWLIYEPLVRLPLEHVPPLSFEGRREEMKYRRGGPKRGRADIGDEESGAPVADIMLEAGDLLYLPRGFVHEARTSDEASLHLTLGIHVLTWLDALSVALGQAANRDERFRRALPVGFANESGATGDKFKEQFDALLEAFAASADMNNALEETAASFITSREAADDERRQAKPDGARAGRDDDAGASTGDAARHINPDTMMRRREGLLCRLVWQGGMAGLSSARGVLWMPADFAAGLRFVARHIEFRAGDIPGLSDNGRLALLRRLVQDGVLRVAVRTEVSG